MARPENSSSVTVTTDTSALSNSCLQKVINITTSPVSLKVADEPLANRTGIIIQADADNNDPVFIGIKTVSTSDYFLKLTEGQTIELSLQKYSSVQIFAVSTSSGKISICEVV